MSKFQPLTQEISWKTLSLGLLSAACWGISTVMTKGILETVAPLPLLFVQLFCSNMLLWGVITSQKTPLLPYRQALRLSLPGLLQPGLSFSAAVVGLSLTTASVEALIWSLETIFIIGLAGLLLRERIGAVLLGLSLVGVLGVGLVSVTADVETAGDYAWLGNGLILLGTFCAALYTVLVRRNLLETIQSVKPLLLTALNQAMGLLGVGAILFLSALWTKPAFSSWSLMTWGLAAASGVMLHAIPFWAFTWVLKRVPASFAAFFLMLIPLFTISGAALFLQESFTQAQWLGAGLVLVATTGVALLYEE